MMDIGIISLLCAIIGAFTGLCGYKIEEKALQKQKGEQAGELQASVIYIKERLDEIILAQKEMCNSINELNIKIARDEEIQRQVQKRIEALEKQVNHYKIA